MVTEAGEVLKRRRVGGPWVPDLSVERPTCGSSKLALDIASSFERRKRAVEQFEELVYAPGTLATKDSLFKLWVQISERCGHPSLPVTCTLMREVAAILRASGFRAVTKKVYEAKGRRIRSGLSWSPQLDAVLQDVRRASCRASGPLTKTEELRPEWWAHLASSLGVEPVEDCLSDDVPFGGIRIWSIATAFMLREIELAHVTIDTTGLLLDVQRLTVRLHLSVQKTDPAARGAWRTLSCSCAKKSRYICPFHCTVELFEFQRQRCSEHGIMTLQDIPLVSRRDNPAIPADKERIISLVQLHQALTWKGSLVILLGDPVPNVGRERVYCCHPFSGCPGTPLL